MPQFRFWALIWCFDLVWLSLSIDQWDQHHCTFFPGVSQPWVRMHQDGQVNLSIGLKGSFVKCNLESIGLACGWIYGCSLGVYLLQGCFLSADEYRESTAAAERFRWSRRAISSAVFQQASFFILFLAVILNYWNSFISGFWSCNKSRVKNHCSIFKFWYSLYSKSVKLTAHSFTSLDSILADFNPMLHFVFWNFSHVKTERVSPAIPKSEHFNKMSYFNVLVIYHLGSIFYV